MTMNGIYAPQQSYKSYSKKEKLLKNISETGGKKTEAALKYIQAPAKIGPLHELA